MAMARSDVPVLSSSWYPCRAPLPVSRLRIAEALVRISGIDGWFGCTNALIRVGNEGEWAHSSLARISKECS